jgi:hypothetical protein
MRPRRSKEGVTDADSWCSDHHQFSADPSYPANRYGLLYDAMETYFREGGVRVFLQRVTGAGALAATHTFNDVGAAASLVVSANSVGVWGNSYKVAIIAGGGGGTYQVQVLDGSNNVLENSPDLTTQQDAISWAQASNYITIALGALFRSHNRYGAWSSSDSRSDVNCSLWTTPEPCRGKGPHRFARWS